MDWLQTGWTEVWTGCKLTGLMFGLAENWLDCGLDWQKTGRTEVWTGYRLAGLRSGAGTGLDEVIHKSFNYVERGRWLLLTKTWSRSGDTGKHSYYY